MPANKALFGKIFISHSSADKAFVRKLVASLEADGFLTWVDEKELLPGDPLATTISEGLARAPAVIVVVSQASIQSRWLKFELNKATDRMVQGGCRVIPVLIETVAVPPEVAGLLYADFSASYDLPLQAVLRALNHDASQAAWRHSFWSRSESLLDEVFDGTGFSFTADEYKSRDLNLVFIDAGDDDSQLSIAYEIVSAHYDPSRSLGQRWIEEYESEVCSASEQLFLVVTERPVSVLLDRLEDLDSRVGFRALGSSNYVFGYIVVADCSKATDKDELRAILAASKELLLKLSHELRRKRDATG